MTAIELFHSKWPTLRRQADYRAARWGLSPPDRADLAQTAALCLWRRCLEVAAAGPGQPDISCVLILAQAALVIRRDRRRRLPVMADLDLQIGHDGAMLEPEALAPPEPSITVNGVRMTLTEARLDDPAGCEIWERGITARELAGRLGVTVQAVQHRARRLGGRCRPSNGRSNVIWRFHPDAGMERAVPAGGQAGGGPGTQNPPPQ